MSPIAQLGGFISALSAVFLISWGFVVAFTAVACDHRVPKWAAACALIVMAVVVAAAGGVCFAVGMFVWEAVL